MSQHLQLKTITTRAELAILLGFKPSKLTYLLFMIPASARYTTFFFPKRSGGMRTISAPIPQLKLLQRNLAALLQDCWTEIQVVNGRGDQLSHGFHRGKSIVTNARKHRNRRFVFNTDISDFFPSINFGRVRGYFIKSKDFELNPDVATAIAQIACHNNSLPQGSPCSPVISNLIGHVLDVQLAALAFRSSCTYSRYADDLTFSTNDSTFPESIATQDGKSPNSWKAGGKLEKLIARNGFKLNAMKTRMQYHESRQEVTGLVVNRRVNIRSDYRHRLRATAHNLFRKGTFELLNSSGTKIPGKIDQLTGMFSFVDSVDQHHKYLRYSSAGNRSIHGKPIGEVSVSEFGRYSSKDLPSPTATERLFRRFLLFKDFYATLMPVVICEGETDNIYLLHALHSLSALFPQLISPPGKSSPARLKIRLYKYVQTRTGQVLGLGDGGGSVLKTLIDRYLTECRKFLALPSQSPCIVLLDNDSGSKPVEGVLKKHGISLTAGPFSHVKHNLYVLRTPPLPGKPSTAIEDFFTPATLASTLDGKSFNGGKDADPTKHYGKSAFATGVVRPNASSIDFSGFQPILQSIADIVTDCGTKPQLSGATP